MSESAAAFPLEVDVHEVKSLLDSPQDFLLLDCRQPREYELVNLPRARLIPMREIPARVAELEEFRNQRIVVYCHHGSRSLRVTHWLRQQGFGKVQNMAGGIHAWAIEVDPGLPRY